MTLYLSIGTNQGDRKSNIKRALEMLEKSFGCHWKALSDIIETPAWGFTGDDFLNCAVSFDIDAKPEDVLKTCKTIERDMGRREVMEFSSDGQRIYHDRIIDIDILLYGNISMQTPDLQIPHPKMKERDFVMRPLMQILDEND